MINQNELRIGNHITDVWASPGCAFEVISFNIRTVKYGAKFVCKWKDAMPVPLTTDILLKCGFRRFVNDFSKSGFIVHTRKKGFFLKKSVPQIQYLHQLQNLYFALTGQELTFKL